MICVYFSPQVLILEDIINQFSIKSDPNIALSFSFFQELFPISLFDPSNAVRWCKFNSQQLRGPFLCRHQLLLPRVHKFHRSSHTSNRETYQPLIKNYKCFKYLIEMFSWETHLLLLPNNIYSIFERKGFLRSDINICIYTHKICIYNMLIIHF